MTRGARGGRGLPIALWIVQTILAVGFASGGLLKMTRPIEELVEIFGWPGALSPGLVRFIGAAELAGGLGLVLPALTRTMPVVAPLSAIGLAIVMLFAMVFHVMRGEFSALPLNVLFGGLATFVAWGRLAKAPIAPAGGR
jgi:putative oxidoreductase